MICVITRCTFSLVFLWLALILEHTTHSFQLYYHFKYILTVPRIQKVTMWRAECTCTLAKILRYRISIRRFNRVYKIILLHQSLK